MLTGKNDKKSIFANGIDLEKCAYGFVMTCKLEHLEYFQWATQGYNPFDLTYHGSQDITPRIGVPTNLQMLTLVKDRNSIWNRI